MASVDVHKVEKYFGTVKVLHGVEVDINDGEFKVMGMSCYGDPSKADLSDIVKVVDGDLWMGLDYVWAPREKRWKGASFGKKFVERFGPPRVGDEIDEPYVHIAAAAQKVLETLGQVSRTEAAHGAARTRAALAFWTHPRHRRAHAHRSGA